MELEVRWVHPSVRDLVIDYLNEDDAERLRFLRVGGVESIMLALSFGGGIDGERVLPLLKTADDWTAATERICELLVRSDYDRYRLLTMLASLARLESTAHHARLRALSAAGLDSVRRHWTAEAAIIPPEVLRAYYESSVAFDPLPPSPPLRPTWDSSRRILGEVSDADLDGEATFDAALEFFELVEVLGRYEPRLLLQVGFPESAMDDLKLAAARLTALSGWIQSLNDELDISPSDGPCQPDDDEVWEAELLRTMATLLEAIGELLPDGASELFLRADWAETQAAARDRRSELWDDFRAERDSTPEYLHGWRDSGKSDLVIGSQFSIEALFSDL